MTLPVACNETLRPREDSIDGSSLLAAVAVRKAVTRSTLAFDAIPPIVVI